MPDNAVPWHEVPEGSGMMQQTAFLQCWWDGCNNVLDELPVESGDIAKTLDWLNIGWWAMRVGDMRLLYTFCSDHGKYHSPSGHRCFDGTCSGIWQNGELYKKAMANLHIND